MRLTRAIDRGKPSGSAFAGVRVLAFRLGNKLHLWQVCLWHKDGLVIFFQGHANHDELFHENGQRPSRH
jgi:hypothetical protein